MKHVYPRFLIALALSAWLGPGSVHAAEEAQEQEQAQTAAEDGAKAAADASKAKEKKKESKDGGIFIPSEEISEDFAVSFPVDI